MNYELPYDFVLRALYPLRPKIKKMLGCYALMEDKRILMLLRERDNQPEFNGVFIATSPAYHAALQAEIHQSRMHFDLDGMADSWIFISEDLEDFQQKVMKACEMIKQGDIRIGK